MAAYHMALRLSRIALFLKIDPTLAEIAGKELITEDEKELTLIIQTAETGHLKKIFESLSDTLEKTKYSPIPELPAELMALELTAN